MRGRGGGTGGRRRPRAGTAQRWSVRRSPTPDTPFPPATGRTHRSRSGAWRAVPPGLPETRAHRGASRAASWLGSRELRVVRDATGSAHPLRRRRLVPAEVLRQAERAGHDLNGRDGVLLMKRLLRLRHLARDGSAERIRLAVTYQLVDLSARLVEAAVRGELVLQRASSAVPVDAHQVSDHVPTLPRLRQHRVV